VSFVLGNPIVNTDPSGHRVVCDAEEDCDEAQKLSRLDDEGYWKELIKYDFGVKMADKGGIQGTNRAWDLPSLQQVYDALSNVDRALNGRLFDMISGTTFWLSENTKALYHGDTSSTGIEFEVRSGYVSPYVNIYHEIGHLIDTVPRTADVFSGQLPANADWIGTDSYVKRDYLINRSIADPSWAIAQDAVQDRSVPENSLKSSEQWADTFSNYVAGNVPQGSNMYTFVSGAINTYTRGY
jgi:hypothetical protein